MDVTTKGKGNSNKAYECKKKDPLEGKLNMNYSLAICHIEILVVPHFIKSNLTAV